MTENENYEVPLPPEIKTTLKQVGADIGESLPRGWGFMLMIFSFGDGGITSYISNAKRPDMIKAMREFCDREESSPTMDIENEKI